MHTNNLGLQPWDYQQPRNYQLLGTSNNLGTTNNLCQFGHMAYSPLRAEPFEARSFERLFEAAFLVVHQGFALLLLLASQASTREEQRNRPPQLPSSRGEDARQERLFALFLYHGKPVRFCATCPSKRGQLLPQKTPRTVHTTQFNMLFELFTKEMLSNKI